MISPQRQRLHNYIIIWIGQVASLIGSQISHFALLIWIWQHTGEATAISLLAFFREVPVLVASIFAGILVDRANRKYLMMLGDAIAGCSTILIITLLLTNHLAIWHLFLIGAINGLFSDIQGLAFSASTALMVQKQDYVRVGAMGSIKDFGSGVFAPALAGVLYPLIGLSGILIFDLITFMIAIASLIIVPVPQPTLEEKESAESTTATISLHKSWQELTFGFCYLLQHPSLLILQIFTVSYIFFDNAALLEPVILARTNSDTKVLGYVSSALTLGGLIGATGLGVWGGPKRRIRGLLWGRAIIFSLEMLLGLLCTPWMWMVAIFAAGLFKPTANSCEDAIWMSKVPPSFQGRVFAASSFITGIISPLGLLIAGPLSDFVFEPAMQSPNFFTPVLSNIFGSRPGSGMALQFALFSFIVVLICLVSYAIPLLRNIEDILPDHDVENVKLLHGD
ncbi:MFS transporter [Chlorogloeopsis sp. ULAP02]|uniref:MFS transporter n=1 Tax=Chlorogloeopsis sp. ULAP02 TaxID=3107926 RepID=UPI0031373930